MTQNITKTETLSDNQLAKISELAKLSNEYNLKDIISRLRKESRKIEKDKKKSEKINGLYFSKICADRLATDALERKYTIQEMMAIIIHQYYECSDTIPWEKYIKRKTKQTQETSESGDFSLTPQTAEEANQTKI